MENRKPSWDVVLMKTAEEIATRSDLPTKVGAVISLDTRVISWGYNGYPAGFPHWRVSGREKLKEVHAEMNAILWAARRGIAIEYATMYCNVVPCINCAKAIIQAGIKKVVTTPRESRDKELNPSGLGLLEEAGISVYILDMEEDTICLDQTALLQKPEKML
jgi:dCMP deaminase